MTVRFIFPHPKHPLRRATFNGGSSYSLNSDISLRLSLRLCRQPRVVGAGVGAGAGAGQLVLRLAEFFVTVVVLVLVLVLVLCGDPYPCPCPPPHNTITTHRHHHRYRHRHHCHRHHHLPTIISDQGVILYGGKDKDRDPRNG